MSTLSDDLFGFLAAARAAKSLPDLDNSFAKLIGCWGFDRWTTLPIASPARGPVRPFEVVFGRGSRAWSARYREKKYFMHDAALRALHRSNEAIWWTKFARTARLSPDERRLFDEARAFGVGEGLSAPIRLADQSVWACAMTGPDVRPHPEVTDAARFAAEGYLISALGFHDVGIVGAGSPAVTPAQIEIVRMLARGMNLKQSAQALRRSPSTVYNQIADAKSRMAVKTVAELLQRVSAGGML